MKKLNITLLAFTMMLSLKVNAQYTFECNFDNGFCMGSRHCDSKRDCSTQNLPVVDDPGSRAGNSLRSKLWKVDERAEVRSNPNYNPPQVNKNNKPEAWYAAKYYFPSSYDWSYGNHECPNEARADARGNQTIILQMNSYPMNNPRPCQGIGSHFVQCKDAIHFEFQRSDGQGGTECTKHFIGDITTNKWLPITIHAKWSGDTDGYLQIWFGDDLVFNQDNIRTYWHNEDTAPKPKFGLYYGNPWTGVDAPNEKELYVDDIRIKDGSSSFEQMCPECENVDTGEPISDADALQAEDASIGGGSEIDSNHSGFNGSGFVNFPDDEGYVEFNNVDGGSGGEATLTLRYALGSPDRTGMLIINGQSQPLTTPSTGSWSSWQEKTLNVTLQAGKTNTIRIATNGDDLANLDQIKVEVSTSAAVAVQLRAKMLNGNNGKLSLRIDDQEVKSWTVQGNSYATYSANISEAQSQSSDIQLYFADTDNATDVQVDYLQIGEERYETEDQQENTATWQNNSCGGSYSDKLYCQGYVAFGSSNNARAVSHIEKGKLTSDQLSGEGWAYPSPTTGKVHLPLGQPGEQPTRIRVLDITGREVLRTRVQGSKQAVELNLSGQQEGLYFIHLEGRQQKRVLKVLKQ